MPILDFCEVFHALAASPEMVIENIAERTFEDQIKNGCSDTLLNTYLSFTDAWRFLQFTTGSSVCVTQPIRIVLNNLMGLLRRPIDHTCSCTLELSQSYATYLDLLKNFKLLCPVIIIGAWMPYD